MDEKKKNDEKKNQCASYDDDNNRWLSNCTYKSLTETKILVSDEAVRILRELLA